jgi:hypothetical protein
VTDMPASAQHVNARPPGLGKFRQPAPKSSLTTSSAEACDPQFVAQASGSAQTASRVRFGNQTTTAGALATHRSGGLRRGPAGGGARPYRSEASSDDDGDLEPGASTHDDFDYDEGDHDDVPVAPEDDGMIAEMQRSTGLDYDSVVRLLREYRQLKDDEEHPKPKKNKSVKLPAPTDDDGVTPSSVAPFTGPRGTEKTRLQEQLDSLLDDLASSKHEEAERQLHAERVITAAREKERRVKEAAAAGYLTRGPVDTPASLKVRDAFVARHEAEMEARRMIREMAEERKREAEREAQAERRQRAFASNMAIKKRIETGDHLTTLKTRTGNGNVRSAVARDIALANSKPKPRTPTDENFAVDFDKDGLPVLATAKVPPPRHRAEDVGSDGEHE